MSALFTFLVLLAAIGIFALNEWMLEWVHEKGVPRLLRWFRRGKPPPPVEQRTLKSYTPRLGIVIVAVAVVGLAFTSWWQWYELTGSIQRSYRTGAKKEELSRRSIGADVVTEYVDANECAQVEEVYEYYDLAVGAREDRLTVTTLLKGVVLRSQDSCSGSAKPKIGLEFGRFRQDQHDVMPTVIDKPSGNPIPTKDLQNLEIKFVDERWAVGKFRVVLDSRMIREGRFSIEARVVLRRWPLQPLATLYIDPANYGEKTLKYFRATSRASCPLSGWVDVRELNATGSLGKHSNALAVSVHGNLLSAYSAQPLQSPLLVRYELMTELGDKRGAIAKAITVEAASF